MKGLQEQKISKSRVFSQTIFFQLPIHACQLIGWSWPSSRPVLFTPPTLGIGDDFVRTLAVTGKSFKAIKKIVEGAYNDKTLKWAWI
jgi:hypothetical protein